MRPGLSLDSAAPVPREGPLLVLAEGRSAQRSSVAAEMTFEEATARWVQRYFRGVDPNPLIGSVTFDPGVGDDDDFGVIVKWQEEHEFPGPTYRIPGGRQLTMRKRVVDKKRFVTDIELTDIIREIVNLSTQA